MAALNLVTTQHYKNVQFSQLTVGTTEVAFPAVNATVVKPENIFVQAPTTNTGNITIGYTGLSSGGAGIQLAPGANMNLPLLDTSVLYAIASGAGQALNVSYQSGVV
jgi:hypothetical protein